jgi:hypothetical protein
MKLDRLRAPALAAIAVLVISGAGTALASMRASPAPANVTPVIVTTPAPAATEQPTAEATAEPTEGPDGTEAPGTASDGSGGHQDAPGQNVDHQFDGQE